MVKARKHLVRVIAPLLLVIACMLTGSAFAASNSNAKGSAGYRLLIYYGTPSKINNADSIETAAAAFAKYDYIVLGAGLEHPENGAHSSTVQIIARIHELHPGVHIYGYIDLGITTTNLTLSAIRTKVGLWKETGADGIFYDDAGYDYGVSRKRLNEAVDYAHSRAMKVFMNAWKPDDIMSSAVNAAYNPKGEKTRIGGGDLYLLESLLQPADITDSGSPSLFRKQFRAKMDLALKYRNLLGIKLMSISAIDYNSYSENAVRKFFRANEATAGVFSLDGYGIAPTEYSTGPGTNNVMRTMPYILNYMDYYDAKAVYTAKYSNQDFASRGFRIHSLPGEHYYNYPDTVVYE